MVDMGVKPFLVSAAVQAIMAQRLVRVLCPDCKQGYQPPDSELRSIGLDPARAAAATVFRAVGCSSCDGTGYRGRLGIFELMELDATLRDMTFRGEPTDKLRQQARIAGMTTLTEDGVRKVVEGKTSVEELLRVTAAV
jgi:type II secretory ATPase GspE/PulE/Tfp pilus assembly ATPase PilB-like protein